MMILAFDTTSEKGGVGIFRDGQSLATIPNEGPANRYSITLFEMVERALENAGLRLNDIDLFAAANGPGSFTGIRVGLAAARGWGKALDRPVRGVSVLEALVRSADPTTEWAFPILDARRGEFFLGAFRIARQEMLAASKLRPQPVSAGWVLKSDSLRTIIKDQMSGGLSGTCVVRAHDQAAAELRTALPASLAWHSVEGDLVHTIAEIAAMDISSSAPDANATLDAYYIRRPDAELNWKD